jgi:hypothetical protein
MVPWLTDVDSRSSKQLMAALFSSVRLATTLMKGATQYSTADASAQRQLSPSSQPHADLMNTALVCCDAAVTSVEILLLALVNSVWNTRYTHIAPADADDADAPAVQPSAAVVSESVAASSSLSSAEEQPSPAPILQSHCPMILRQLDSSMRSPRATTPSGLRLQLLSASLAAPAFSERVGPWQNTLAQLALVLDDMSEAIRDAEASGLVSSDDSGGACINGFTVTIPASYPATGAHPSTPRLAALSTHISLLRDHTVAIASLVAETVRKPISAKFSTLVRSRAPHSPIVARVAKNMGAAPTQTRGRRKSQQGARAEPRTSRTLKEWRKEGRGYDRYEDLDDFIVD